MLRAQLKRISLVSTHRSPTGAGPSRRKFGFSASKGWVAVPVLRPTLWSLAATAAIFIGCATYDVHRDIQHAKGRGLYKKGSINSYEDLEEAARYRGNVRHATSHSSPSSIWYPSAQIKTVLAGYSDAEKLTLGAAALNLSIFGASSLAPEVFAQYFAHIPVISPNYTLLTSAFGHVGLLHIAINTFGLLEFAPDVARTSVFEGNGSHFAAFYLSAGILSSLADHLATTLPSRTYRFTRYVPSMGASGIVTAMFGAWGTVYSDETMDFVLIPGEYPVRSVIAALVLFETYGLFIGIPYVNFAHGAHLAGLGIGVAYVHFDGKKHLWRPTRRAVFHCMKRLNMV
ncbi:hypothetical protein F5Y13DRAFT_149516 [Hypoxylon sp. FL1857]|nr:hypothetical protein F5Y13DRAFT_149516 [Hypoxylon sp. FL1857]